MKSRNARARSINYMKLSVKDLNARYDSSNGPVYAVEDVRL